MKRRAIFHTVLLWLSVVAILGIWTCLVKADIEVKPQYNNHEPITPHLVIPNMPEGAVLRKTKFKCPGAAIVKVDESTFFLWAKPGSYTIEATGTWRLYQTIIDKQDKEWKVIADEDDYEFTASFTVGGVVPPDPFPPLPPDPPSGPLQVMFFVTVEQRDNLPRDQRAIFTSLVERQWLTGQGHVFVEVLDPTRVDPGSVPEQYRAWMAAVKGKSLPCVGIAPKDGGNIVVHPLPADSAAFRKLISGKAVR